MLYTPPHGDAVTVGYRPERVYLKRTFTSLTRCACGRTNANLPIGGRRNYAGQEIGEPSAFAGNANLRIGGRRNNADQVIGAPRFTGETPALLFELL